MTLVWIILMENLNLITLIIGVAVAWACLMYSNKFLPLKKLEKVNFLRLITYPFYLMGQIYASGLYVIRIIFTGERVDVVKVKTKLKAEVLRVILADSITLTPGSILLDLNDDTLTLIWLRPKTEPDPEITRDADERLKNKLENQIIKADMEQMQNNTQVG